MGGSLKAFPKIKKETRVMVPLSILIAYDARSNSYSSKIREANNSNTAGKGRSPRILICR